MRKLNIIVNAIGIVILVWIIISAIEVNIYNGNENHEYSRSNVFVIMTETKSETVTVVECIPEGNYYEVTVEDSKGNLWAYYDDEPQTMGTTLRESYAKGEE